MRTDRPEPFFTALVAWFRQLRDSMRGDAPSARTRTMLLRALRKVFHLARRATGSVEDRATRLIQRAKLEGGADPTDAVPVEELYYERLPHIVPLHPALPLRGRQGTVTLLLPSLDNASFFGGTATALAVAALLAEHEGKDLRVVQTLSQGKAPLEAFLETEGITFSGRIHTLDVSMRTHLRYGYVDIHPDDVFVTSAWWDAYLVDRLPLERPYVYLIQDYEPIFYPNSDRWVLAESTYHSDRYVALCNTRLMYDFMLDRGYEQVAGGTWFEPAVSRIAAVPQERSSERRRMFVYGRPHVQRNLFLTALQSLEICFGDGLLDPREWEVFMAGQDDLPDLALGGGVVIVNLGKMDYAAYHELLGTVDVAVSLMMAPHPNYPTLELATSGAAVVSTRWGLKHDLSRYSGNILMSEIEPRSIAAAIAEAAAMPAGDRLRNAAATSLPPSWPDALATPLATISERLHVDGGG